MVTTTKNITEKTTKTATSEATNSTFPPPSTTTITTTTTPTTTEPTTTTSSEISTRTFGSPSTNHTKSSAQHGLQGLPNIVLINAILTILMNLHPKIRLKKKLFVLLLLWFPT